MRATIKLGLGVGLLAGVVFGLTFISQYTAGTDSPKPGAGGGPDGAVGGPPLSFSTTRMVYDPASEELAHRQFGGFYEVSPVEVPASFWFQNPHPVPVTVTVRGRSCSSCTSARVAVVPADAVAAVQSRAAADLAVGAGAFPGLAAGLTAAAAVSDQTLKWQTLDFTTPDVGVEIPAAAAPDRPTWGILQLRVVVSGIGPKQLSAAVGMQIGTKPGVVQGFAVTVVGMFPFEVDPVKISLGDLPDGMAPRKFDLTCWSATRTPAELPPPAAAANSADGFVTVGPPVPMAPAERSELARQLAVSGRPARVLAGYKVPVTVHRRRPAGAPGAGPAEPDIGPFDRQVGVSGPGNMVASISLSGTVTGVVSLVDGAAIDLKDFNGKYGTERDHIRLVSDRADVTLALDPAGTKPNYLTAALSPPRDDTGRRFWTLKVGVPAEACREDLPPDSVIVLTGTSHGEPLRVRLPVKGRGFSKR